MDPSTAQTIGQLIEGQRVLESRLDRLESKVDKLLWVGFGIICSVVAALVTGIVALLAQ